jgi:hypothetical protein
MEGMLPRRNKGSAPDATQGRKPGTFRGKGASELPEAIISGRFWRAQQGSMVLANKYTDFEVTGDPTTARATAERALTDRKFKVQWQDEWSGVAERGNKVANAFAGAFAQYFKVAVKVMSSTPGQTVVRIERQSSGYAGGAIGATRTTKNMQSLTKELEATFKAAGVLVGVAQG